ncbi:MAG: PRD domain-containing protein [Treponema sp.]|jgi:transcriptional antiterminator/mannitol/fructose-specific phosphotransferase system IIA component (Ntr-type)|nr:PRD domain-containing protein [Treponema sp.]
MACLTPRSYLIAARLVSNQEPSTIADLARELQVSDRTIRYDLDTLEYWFKDRNVSLKKKSNVGVFLDKRSPGFESLQGYFRHPTPLQQVYSNDERKYIMIIKILEGGKIYTTSDLASFANVSKSTASKDLKEVESYLNNYRIKLIKRTNVGIEAQGNESDVRRALAELILETYGYIALLQLMHKLDLSNTRHNVHHINRIIDFWENVPAREIQLFLSRLQDLFHVVFTDEDEAELFVFLSVGLKRLGKNNTIDMGEAKLKKLKAYEEYRAVETAAADIFAALDLSFTDDEIAYLTMYVLSTGINSRDSRAGGKYTQDLKNVRTVLKKFIRAVGKKINLDISGDEELLEDLLLEIKPLVIRAKFDIRTENTKRAYINRYQPEYKAVVDSVSLLEKNFSIKLSDVFFTNVTIHVAAAVERKTLGKVNKYLAAVVVCSTGVGTAKLLSSRISSEFPQIKIIGQLSLLEYQGFDNKNTDLIFTTIPLPEKKGCIIIEVDPILNQESIQKVHDHIHNFPIEENESHGRLQRILTIIERNCTIKDRDNLLKELDGFYHGKTLKSATDLRNGPPLCSLVTGKTMAFDVLVSGYQEAVSFGGTLLLENHLIDQPYIAEMVTAAETFKSNIVIVPHIAMPHAQSKGYVKKVCMSLVHLKKPVFFGYPRYDPVKILFCLGAVDDHSHYRAVSDLLFLLENQAMSSRILNARNAEEILFVINQIPHYQEE